MKAAKIQYAFIALALALFSAPPVSAGSSDAVEHKVLKGDDLHLLAGYYYRDPRRWNEIYQANRSAIKNPNRLVPGKTLILPAEGLNAYPLPYADWKELVGG